MSSKQTTVFECDLCGRYGPSADRFIGIVYVDSGVKMSRRSSCKTHFCVDCLDGLAATAALIKSNSDNEPEEATEDDSTDPADANGIPKSALDEVSSEVASDA